MVQLEGFEPSILAADAPQTPMYTQFHHNCLLYVLMVVIPSKPSARHAAFRRAPRRVVCNTLNINSPQFRRDQSTPRIDSLSYPLFDLAKDANFVEGFLQLFGDCYAQKLFNCGFLLRLPQLRSLNLFYSWQIGNTSWLSTPTFAIGLATQWCQVLRSCHFSVVTFVNSRHLSHSCWAWYLIPTRFRSRYQPKHFSHPSWLLRW